MKLHAHSGEMAKAFSTRIIAMKSGEGVFDGTPEELDGEALTRIYGRNILEEKEEEADET